MSVLARAELLLQAKNYSGSGDWLDESGNGHDAQLGSTSGADTNDPLFLSYDGTQYVYFPGTANNEFSIAGLSNSTVYDYTVTYEDDTTADGSETTDGSGNLVLGNTQTNFDDKKVKDVTVVPDGGGAEAAGVAASAFSEPFASATGRQGLTWTINRASSGRVSTVVDRDMFLLGTDDYFEIADAAGLNFANGESFTLMFAGRRYVAPTAGDTLVSKRDAADEGYYLRLLTTDGQLQLTIEDTGGTGTQSLGADAPVGNAFVTTGRRDAGAPELDVFLDGVSGGAPSAVSVGDITSTVPMRLGARPDVATNFFDGEIHATTLWREALTDAEIAQAGEELLLLLPDAPAHRRRRKYLLRTRGRAR